MPARLNLITGATGLLGSHLAERLVARGERVRALVRPTSDVSLLRHVDVEFVTGSLECRDSLRQAVSGADVVYHCAAKVGDWGPWSLFQAGTIDATRNMVDACREAGVPRLLHVSSVAVYGHPHDGQRQFNEEEPLGQNLWRWDHYPRAKIAAETEARRLGQAATIVRPTWIYGPRDRAVLPRIIKAIRTGRISIVGPGDNLLNMVHADDVAEGAILAANRPAAAGQVYNLSSSGEITQRELLNTLCDWINAPRVRRRVPLRLALRVGLISELIGRAIRLQRPPYITRHGVSLLSRPTRYSSQKARDDLGWQPQIKLRDGLEAALRWLEDSGALGPPSPSEPQAGTISVEHAAHRR
jgi:nucleoside-diphosphate-sugar epimerase